VKAQKPEMDEATAAGVRFLRVGVADVGAENPRLSTSRLTPLKKVTRVQNLRDKANFCEANAGSLERPGGPEGIGKSWMGTREPLPRAAEPGANKIVRRNGEGKGGQKDRPPQGGSLQV